MLSIKEDFFMPKNKLQEVVFGILMVIVMVYAMVCYNIALNLGEFTNRVFLMALSELPIMCPITFIIEMAFVGRLSKSIAFKILNPQKDSPFFITLAISCVTVTFMCPIMSLIATVLFNRGGEILSTWIKACVHNFPMALCWQVFYAGPLVRTVFKLIFKDKPLTNTEIA